MTTNLPDWLVERVALDEVPAASRPRVERANAGELAARVAAVREANDRELAAHPVRPAVAQIDARVAAAKQRARKKQLALIGGLVGAAAAIVLVVSIDRSSPSATPVIEDDEVTRVKGSPRLRAFRLAEDRVERLLHDSLVKAGDIIQLRYAPSGQAYGVIASIDGAGVVTLHFPPSEDASTALADKPTSLPDAYALDDAPRFERFFFITSDQPVDVAQSLAALRVLAQHADAANAAPQLPAGVRHSSLRLRKEDRHDK